MDISQVSSLDQEKQSYRGGGGFYNLQEKLEQG